MTFEDLWAQVDGLPDMAKVQIPGILSIATKRKLGKRSPEEIKRIVSDAIEEVNHGSIEPLDELINRRL